MPRRTVVPLEGVIIIIEEPLGDLTRRSGLKHRVPRLRAVRASLRAAPDALGGELPRNAPAAAECQATSKVSPRKCVLASVPRSINAMSESNSPKTDTSSSSLLRRFRFQKKPTRATNMCKSSRIFSLFLPVTCAVNRCNRCASFVF